MKFLKGLVFALFAVVCGNVAATEVAKEEVKQENVTTVAENTTQEAK